MIKDISEQFQMEDYLNRMIKEGDGRYKDFAKKLKNYEKNIRVYNMNLLE
ncbi:hypothetical protein [Sebaldella termitidis]|nr:hypothetical protein [Sebaldella termitidis]